jgi:DNA-binding NarL/FixJ family response regulator
VLVCDEYPLFRRQLLLALEQASDIEVLGEAPDADVALSVAEQLAPDVAFIGMQLPPVGGVRTARRLRKLLPTIALALAVDPSDERDDRDLIRAVRAGITAFVPRDHPDQYAVDVAHGLLARRPALDPAAATAVLTAYAATAPRGDEGSAPPTLEPRERSVLESLAGGSTILQASTALGISITTGSNVVANALDKLHRHARSTTAASASGTTSSGRPPAG